jgi:integrase
VPISIQRRTRRHGAIRYTATVRRNGLSLSSTFGTKKLALNWAVQCENAVDAASNAGVPFDRGHWLRQERTAASLSIIAQTGRGEGAAIADEDPLPRADWTLKRALEEYDRTATAKLKGARQVKARLRAWQKEPLAQKRLSDITPRDIATWCDSRRKGRIVRDEKGTPVGVVHLPVAASTIRNDIFRISVLYKHAHAPVTRGGWALDLTNPVAEVSLATLPPGRQRRLDDGHDQNAGEETKMIAALRLGPDGEQMVALVVVALETGMRRSEILDLRANEVKSSRMGRVIERSTSKNGLPRRVILSPLATEVIDTLGQNKIGDTRLFSLDGDAVAWRWNKARKSAGCPDLRMHDLRHEAISRMADAGLSVGSLAALSGHRNMQTLLRYVNASETDIRAKLAKK